jgi:lysophospholipase L1-like esterase
LPTITASVALSRRGWRVSAGVLVALSAGCATQSGAAAPPVQRPDGIWRTAAAQAMSTVRRTAVDETCREVVRVSAAGTLLRLRLSNVLSPTPLHLAAVTVAVRATEAAADPATLRPVTFGGRAGVTIPAGADVSTDPVALRVAAGTDLLVSFAVTGTARLSEHQHGVPTSYCTPAHAGNRAAVADGTGFTPAGHDALVVDDIAVATDAGTAKTILAIGDSLSDARLTPGQYARWSDVLTDRLRGQAPVANAAIDGNRLLAPGGYGPTITQRFDRDVLSRAGVGTLVMLAGTNDITAGVTAEQLTTQLASLVARAHDRGLRVVLMTLTPAHKRTADKEQVRQAVNSWIRTAGTADQVIDADAVLRDPAQPRRLLPSYDFGDGLHLSVAGQHALGEAVAKALRT